MNNILDEFINAQRKRRRNLMALTYVLSVFMGASIGYYFQLPWYMALTSTMIITFAVSKFLND